MLGAILIVISLFSMIFAVSAFQNLKKMESEFSEKKAKLMKENLDLKDRLDSLQEVVDQKTESLAVLERGKSNFDAQIEALKNERREAAGSYKKEGEALKQRIAVLKKRIAAMEETLIIPCMREAAGKEENENIRNVLKYALNKIELIKSGKYATMESGPAKQAGPADEEIPVQETAVRAARQGLGYEPSQEARQRRDGGTIMLVDRRNRIIAINLGNEDGIKEGDRCKIIKDDQVLGSAEIMNVRSRISAAFIDDLQGKHIMNDIEEGSRVKVIEQ